MPFTEIAKQMNVSAGTIHVRVKKMEDAGIIKGSSLILDYGKLDYHFIAFMGILLTKSDKSQEVLNELVSFPNVVEASLISGKYSIFCKIQAKDTEAVLAQCPKAQVFVVANAQHWVHAEKPETVVRAIQKFIDKEE